MASQGAQAVASFGIPTTPRDSQRSTALTNVVGVAFTAVVEIWGPYGRVSELAGELEQLAAPCAP